MEKNQIVCGCRVKFEIYKHFYSFFLLFYRSNIPFYYKFLPIILKKKTLKKPVANNQIAIVTEYLSMNKKAKKHII